MQKSKTLFITQTAVIIAALIATQFVTRSLSTWVTGSLVNFILILSALMVGTAGGLIVAAVSPFFAFFLGIGTPIIAIVPCIALGNMSLVLIYSLFMQRLPGKLHDVIKWIITIPTAAVIKFLLLYVLVVRVALSVIPEIPPKQAAGISTAFGLPQLFTALIGGTIAFIIVPLIKKNIK